MSTIILHDPAMLPAPVLALGEPAARRFVEFFTAQLANANTRTAYARAVRRLCDWCEARNLALLNLEPIAAAAYVEDAKSELSLPSLKQHLSALRRLFDWSVQRRFGTPLELHQIMRRKVIRRSKALERTTEKAIRSSSFLKERKEELARAWRIHVKKQREREQGREVERLLERDREDD